MGREAGIGMGGVIRGLSLNTRSGLAVSVSMIILYRLHVNALCAMPL